VFTEGTDCLTHLFGQLTKDYYFSHLRWHSSNKGTCVQVSMVQIAGYTEAIPQPCLRSEDRTEVLARCGDEHVQLSQQDLVSIGEEAAAICTALDMCDWPISYLPVIANCRYHLEMPQHTLLVSFAPAFVVLLSDNSFEIRQHYSVSRTLDYLFALHKKHCWAQWRQG
jgi:hypothetical protein